MHITEYEKNLDAIKVEFSKKKNSLYREYALSNNTIKIGDRVMDHIGIILVQSIGVTITNNIPSCIYTGPVLKKNGEHRLDGSIRTVYQNNIR